VKFVGQDIEKLEPRQDTQTRFFTYVTLTLTRWPGYTNLT